VSQISPPIRIVLIAVVGLLAAWMLFLRPKTEPTPAPTPAPATAPGVTGLSKAVDKAKDASAASDKANEKVQKATGDDAAKADAGKSGSAKETAPQFVTGRELPLEPLTAEQTKDLPKVIVKALDQRKVFVVGVFDTKEKRWARMARDDRAVRRELAETNRYKGQVVATSSTLGKLSSLNAVIGDLGVTQTPSVVVVDRNRKAVVLTGFVERNAINQAIADARRNSTEVRITNPYVRTLNRTCANLDIRLDRFDLPATRAQVKPASRRFGRLISQYRTKFASLKAPAKYKPIQRHVDRYLAKGEDLAVALRSGNFAKMDAALTALAVSAAGLDRKFANAGATACVSNRKS
jgi:hypothetical protein